MQWLKRLQRSMIGRSSTATRSIGWEIVIATRVASEFERSNSFPKAAIPTNRVWEAKRSNSNELLVLPHFLILPRLIWRVLGEINHSLSRCVVEAVCRYSPCHRKSRQKTSPDCSSNCDEARMVLVFLLSLEFSGKVCTLGGIALLR